MKTSKLAYSLATLTLIATGFQAIPAAADTEISLSASTGVVFNGSTATITPSDNSYDATSAEWTNFKYEIVVSGGMADSVTNQVSSNVCLGEAGSVSSSRRDCLVKTGDGRHVIAAGVPSGGYVYQSSLKIIPRYGTSTKYLIRGWVDRNNDNRIDSYEQASVVTRVQGLDANYAKSAIRFHVEPPLVQDTNVRAWVSATSSDPVVGSGGAVSGLIDPALLSVQVVNCQSVPCSTTTISGAWNYNRYQRQHEFKGTQAFSHGAKLTFNLFYNPWADSSLATAIKLGSQSYDYTNSWVRSATTEITSSDLLKKVYPVENYLFANQRQSFADTNLLGFKYSAQLTGADFKPLANQEVYLNVDLHDVTTWAGIKADDVPLTGVVDERVQLRRVTDELGRVEVNFSVPKQGSNSQIAIDLISGGLRAHEIGGTARQEVLVWQSDVTRHLVLSFAKARTGDAEGLRLNAFVRNSEGDPISAERIVFGADSQLVLSSSLPSLYLGSAYTDVKVSHSAPPSGSAVIKAQIVSGKSLLEKTVTVRWEERGLVMWGYAEAAGAPVALASYVGKHGTGVGGQISAAFKLSTASYAAKAFEPVTLTLEGPGELVQTKPTTSKTGMVNFKINFATGEKGVSSVKVYVPRSGFVKIFKVMAGVTAGATVNDGLLQVSVKNAKDSSVSVRIGSEAAYRKTANSDNFTFTARRFETSKRQVSIYVSGIKVFSEYLKF